MRRPLKRECFQVIKSLNIPIETIVDVGVLTGTWDLQTEFKDKKHILIEPIVEWNDKINDTYGSAGIDYDLLNVAAYNRDGRMKIKTVSVVPGKPISHASLTERSSGDDLREVPVRRLDTLLPEIGASGPYLLKIDVDGVEIDIIEGAEKILPKCSVIVVEANVQNFIERSNILSDKGFSLFDIVDPCYYDSRLRQIDLVFMNTKMIDRLGIDMYKEKFEYEKWYTYK